MLRFLIILQTYQWDVINLVIRWSKHRIPCTFNWLPYHRIRRHKGKQAAHWHCKRCPLSYQAQGHDREWRIVTLNKYEENTCDSTSYKEPPDQRMRPRHFFRWFETESKQKATNSRNQCQRAKDINSAKPVVDTPLLYIKRQFNINLDSNQDERKGKYWDLVKQGYVILWVKAGDMLWLTWNRNADLLTRSVSKFSQ